MVDFKTIYSHHSLQYDALVSHEDWQENLSGFLNQNIDFTGKNIIEFGTGTGRLTRMFAEHAGDILCCEGSAHMLERGYQNLEHFGHKISFLVFNNRDIQNLNQKADLILEGWSFGHTVSDGPESVEYICDELVDRCRKKLNPGGSLVFIETLGTNTDVPHPPSEKLSRFYSRLERVYNFQRHELRTDYRFSSVDDAANIAGFFFGEDLKEFILQRGLTIIPECTGIWIWKDLK